MDRQAEPPRLLGALTAVVALACLAGCQWSEAEEFEERLRCGMSPEEVAAVADELGAESFRAIAEPHEFTTHVLTSGSTFFEFHFGADGLDTVRRGASVGLTTGTSYEPRMNLCTGEVTDHLSLTIKGSEPLAGASIFVDGTFRGRLSGGPGYQMNIALTTGSHEISIEHERYEPLVLPVEYGPGVDAAELVLPPPRLRE